MHAEDIKKAANFLREGKIVIFPTETVYGIGASAYNHDACRKIYQIKNRPCDNPLIIHVATLEQIESIAYVPEFYQSLLSKFMPGPLTCIFKKKDSPIFTSGLNTIAVRIPQSSIARDLLIQSALPIAAPSANISGYPSITRYKDVMTILGPKVDFVLSGPDCEVGMESTVIDLSGSIPYYLRPGSITFEALKNFIPQLQRWEKIPTTNTTPPQYFQSSLTALSPISPGMKYRHYAPHCQVFTIGSLNKIPSNLPSKEWGYIGFELAPSPIFTVQVKNNIEYMQRLYSFFIDCDRMNLKYAYCQMPLMDELQEAILHRLVKAQTKL